MLLLFAHFSGITSNASFLSNQAFLEAAAAGIKAAIYSAVEELYQVSDGRTEVRKFVNVGYPISAKLKQENGRWIIETEALGQSVKSPLTPLKKVIFQGSSSGGDYIIVYARFNGDSIIIKLENYEEE